MIFRNALKERNFQSSNIKTVKKIPQEIAVRVDHNQVRQMGNTITSSSKFSSSNELINMYEGYENSDSNQMISTLSINDPTTNNRERNFTYVNDNELFDYSSEDSESCSDEYEGNCEEEEFTDDGQDYLDEQW